MLVIRLRSLGDSILTLPLLDALSGWRPDLELDVLVESPFAPVFAGHPAVHETIVLRSRSSPIEEGWSRSQTVWNLRSRGYPAVVNLHGGTTSALLTLASGSRIRLGQETYRNAWCYNARIPKSSAVWGRTELHTVEHQLTLARWLGIPISNQPSPRLTVDPKARADVARRLAQFGIDSKRLILIHPTATLWTKQWPPGNFAALADRLVRERDVRVIFTAAPIEAGTLEEIRRHAKSSFLYWSDLGLPQLFALIETCTAFVGNDSGPTHAAAALRKPIVVVWGSSNYAAWRPWGTHFESVRSDLPCMPCPGYTCHAFGKPKCILDLNVDRVWEACVRILDGRWDSDPPPP